MLYSVAVFFYAEENIRFRTYETEALHGLTFNLFSRVDPDLAREIHDGEEKPFTLSNLMPFTQREGTVKVLDKGQTYKFRMSFFEINLFHTLIRALQTPEPIQLNGVSIVPIQVLSNDADEPWCGQTTFEDLLRGKSSDRVTFNFLTTTSFRRGERNYLLPTPEVVFDSLLTRWHMAGGPQLTLTREMLEQVEISRYNLKTRREQFSNYSVKGFTGECEYWFGNLPQRARQELLALARFSFYAGVGYKTTMGLGQVRLVE